MRRAIPPLPQYVYMAWCLVRHRDSFAFYLYLVPAYMLRTWQNVTKRTLTNIHTTELQLTGKYLKVGSRENVVDVSVVTYK
jgi:hypothetical protein